MARFHNFGLTDHRPTRWECKDEDDVWGGHGGETTKQNLRRSKREAREHTEETGHSTTVLVIEGFWT